MILAAVQKARAAAPAVRSDGSLFSRIFPARQSITKISRVVSYRRTSKRRKECDSIAKERACVGGGVGILFDPFIMISLKKISTGSNSSQQSAASSSSVGEAVSMETSSDSNNNANRIEIQLCHGCAFP